MRQNAATSREETMPHVIEKTRGPKRKVVVVGAGPAGLEAARVAKSRGHDVVLFEKNDYVGGQIMLAAKAPQREQMPASCAGSTWKRSALVWIAVWVWQPMTR